MQYAGTYPIEELSPAPHGYELPLARPEDVRIGAYLADSLNYGLYCVLDTRQIIRDGRRVRMAMLENAITEDIEGWEFGKLAALRVVPYRRESFL